ARHFRQQLELLDVSRPLGLFGLPLPLLHEFGEQVIIQPQRGQGVVRQEQDKARQVLQPDFSRLALGIENRRGQPPLPHGELSQLLKQFLGDHRGRTSQKRSSPSAALKLPSSARVTSPRASSASSCVTPAMTMRSTTRTQ